MAEHPNQSLIDQEATRLLALPTQIARAQFGDRVARALLVENDHQRKAMLDFNARLATELRKRAQARGVPTIWGGF